MVSVNVSNLISSESSSKSVHVLEKVAGLNVTIAPTVLVTSQDKVAVTSEVTVCLCGCCLHVGSHELTRVFVPCV